SASPSMVSLSAPCPAMISRAVASRSRRLRAASARSAGGDPQATGWLMGPPYGPEYNRGKVRLPSRLQLPRGKDQPMTHTPPPDNFPVLPDAHTPAPP